jgi:hypothetical protein
MQWNMLFEPELDPNPDPDPEPELAHLDAAPTGMVSRRRCPYRHGKGFGTGDEDVATPATDLERGGDVLIAVGRGDEDVATPFRGWAGWRYLCIAPLAQTPGCSRVGRPVA